MDKYTSGGDFCVLTSHGLCPLFGGGGQHGKYVCTEWQRGETTASTGWLGSSLSHQTIRILVYVVIEDFFFFFCLFFLLLQNVVELRKSLLVLEKAQQTDSETE